MIDIKNIAKLNSQFFLIAGPCVVENEDSCFEIANHLNNLCRQYDIAYVFKASYKKANRTRLDSFTGIGDEKALKIIDSVRSEFDIPAITDVHESKDAEIASKYVNALQIPAFLSRQTDLIVAAAKTGLVVNIKKAQFAAPSAMIHSVQKVIDSGNDNVWITERGSSFGYQNLVVDFSGFPVMKSLNKPLILDCTHSLQIPNQSNGVTGGKPKYIETISKAGIAAGVDGLFMETHPKPSESKSDGANMLPLNEMEDLLEKLCRIRAALD